MLTRSIPIRRFESRSPSCPDCSPVIEAGVRIGVRVTQGDRQDLDGGNARVRRLHDSVDEKVIQLGHFSAAGTLESNLAAKVVVTRKRLWPDHAEIAFAIGMNAGRAGGNRILLLIPQIPK